MKNKLKSIALVLVAFVTFSTSAQTAKKVNTEKSSIKWTGKKVTGQHEGTINISEGALIFKGKKLVGGNFIVDMTSINTTDLSGGSKKSLDGHLKSDDFFGTDTFPKATLVFKTIGEKSKNVYTVTADLTIKGKTNSVKFEITTKGNTATTTVMIDRTKYDIKYGSGSFFDNLGDKTINDEFQLDVTLTF